MSDDDHGVRPSEDQGGANQKPAGKRFPTVGIGTSAGGVHALQTFFESLPNDVDAAFVVVLHLDPSHQSELPNILANRTQMPVTQVSGLTLIEPRHVYVIPPNRQLVVTDDHLAITEFDEPRWQRGPVHFFFFSVRSPPGGAMTSPSFLPARARTGLWGQSGQGSRGHHSGPGTG